MAASHESSEQQQQLETVSAELVTFAEELAAAAGELILKYWRVPLEVESKHEAGRPVPESPVTVADRGAEEVMRKLIEARYPSHGISGEEFGNVRMDAEYVWVLDPIDGTKSFITGKPLFGTLIALLHRGRPVLGIIDQCVLRERWLGANGCTRLNGKPVRCRGAERLDAAMLYATTPHMFAPGYEQERFARLRESVKRPLYGCDCYAYALVASGFGADLVVEADLGLYDYCALVPVVTCAGGYMTDWNGRELTLASQGESRGRVVAAASREVWASAVAILEERAASGPLVALRSAVSSFVKSSGRSLLLGFALGFAARSCLSMARRR